MSVGPVTIHGVIQRANDVGAVKHQEDSKPMVDQQNIQAHMKNEQMKHLKQVRHADDSENHKKKYDAKEKGNNEYQGQGQQKKKYSDYQQQKKKKRSNEKDGSVVLKAGNSHFDMKI